jgi:hypothetical protein
MANKKGKSKKNKNKRPLIIAAVVVVAVVGYFAIQSGGQQTAGEGSFQTARGVSTVPVTASLIETRPVMAPNRFKGWVSEAYRWAAEIPAVFDQLYCYCKCKENPKFKHKNLLTCFTDTHAAKCNICLKEGQMAWELTKRGIEPQQIRSEIDTYYARLRRSKVF